MREDSQNGRTSSDQTSAWASLDFANLSELATLRVPEQDFHEWLDGAVSLLVHGWRDILQLEADFRGDIARLDWPQRSIERLVKDLHIVGSLEQGIETFLPDSYRAWPIDLRRALYLSIFLLHGHAAIHENPRDDFGLSEFADWPQEARVLFPLARPLWFLVAAPHILNAVRARRSQYSLAATGALLALVHEAPLEAEARWLPLLHETPQALLNQITKSFRRDDLHYAHQEPLGLSASEAFFTTKELQGDRTAGQLLVSALSGQFNHFTTAVKHSLIDAHRKEETHTKYNSSKERMEIVFREREELGENEAQEQEDIADDRRPQPDGLTSERQLLQRLHSIAKRHPRLDPLVQDLLQDSDATDKERAERLSLDPKTIRKYKKELRTYLSDYDSSI